MRLLKLEKVKDGKYIKNYELTYLNKAGREKTYEIVSRKELNSIDDLGKKTSGVSIVATMNDKLLLLHEFRMGVNKHIYNLCAGMLEENETMEECIKRELYEETGLNVAKIKCIMKPSYSAVGISDIKTQIAFVEACGEFSDHTSDNELIDAAFYTVDEVKTLLETEEFSSRAQMAAYHFVQMQNLKDNLKDN